MMSVAMGTAVFAQAPVDLEVCYGKGYTLTSTKDATGTSEVTYQWYENSLPIGSNTPELTIAAGERVPGDYAYVRKAANAECPTGVSSNTFTVRVNPAISPGSITTASTTTQEGTPPGQTVNNSAVASGGSGNLTYVWVRTGTNGSATLTGDGMSYDLNANDANYNTAGTYYFNRYAKDATCSNAAYLAATGTYTLYVNAVATTPGNAASTQTWTFSPSTLVWSDVIQELSCSVTTFTNDNNIPYCRSYTAGTFTGYYYNWAYVSANASTLCPSSSGWRVPTQSDFDELVGVTDYSNLENEWAYGGYAQGEGPVSGWNTRAYFWSTTPATDITAYCLFYDFGILSVPTSRMTNGLRVRCVK
jgi:hypothetical protein